MAALLAAPLGALLLGAPPAHADPDPKLTISDVQLSKTAVSVAGLDVAKVDVTVKAGYNSDNPQDDGKILTVYLDRTAGTGGKYINDMASVPLKRTAGTLKNGTWTGVLNVSSAANGTFKVTSVSDELYGDLGGGMPDEPTPFDGPSIAVTGTHIPKVTSVQTPKIAPVGKPFSVKWTVTDSATGKPYGVRVPFWVGVDSVCVENGQRGTTRVSTDAAGNYTRTYPADDQDAVLCGHVRTEPYSFAYQAFFPRRVGVVTAAPAKTSAKVGTNVPVNGQVTGEAYSCTVNLQRLKGATQWRTVNSGRVRYSGRYTLTATPAYKGKIYYRAQLPVGCGGHVESVSKTFVITGL